MQRATSTVVVALRSASSRASRVLPIPGSPTTVTTRQRPASRASASATEARELLVAADERRVETSLGATSAAFARRAGSADARELDGAGDDGSGARRPRRSRPRRGGRARARRQHRPDRVVVRRPVGAEDGDEPLGAEALEHAAVPVEHVPDRGERLVEPAAVLLGVVGWAACGEDGDEPELEHGARRRP